MERRCHGELELISKDLGPPQVISSVSACIQTRCALLRKDMQKLHNDFQKNDQPTFVRKTRGIVYIRATLSEVSVANNRKMTKNVYRTLPHVFFK